MINTILSAQPRRWPVSYKRPMSRVGCCLAAIVAPIALAFADVQITSARLTDSGTELSVAFDALPFVRKNLYAVCGTRDFGPHTNGWEHVELLASVDPAATTASGTVGSAFSRDIPFLRVVLMLDVNSSTYVDGGALVAQWDGIDNVGRGQHCGETNVWVDLTGHGWNATRSADCKLWWTADSCSMSRLGLDVARVFAVDRQNLQSSLGASWTVEAYVKPTPSNFDNYAGICGAHDTSGQGICFFQYNTGKFDVGTYQKAILEQVDASALVADEKRHLAVTADGEGLQATAYTNAAVLASSAFDERRSSLDNPNFYLGSAYGLAGGRRFDGEIHAIRLYNRVLTAEELAYNRDVDECRFNWEIPASRVVHFGSLQGVEITQVNRSAQSGEVESFDLRLNGVSEQVKIYSAFGSSDGGMTTGSWERVVLAAEVAAGTTEVTVPAPDGFGGALGCIRFFAYSADIASGITPVDYVQDGLLAMWDGEHNAGYGVHGATATVWEDLSGNGWTARNGWAEGSGDSNWGTDAYVFRRTSPKDAFAVIQAGFQSAMGGSWTVEAYVKPTAGAFQNYAGVCGSHTSTTDKNGLAFWQHEGSSFKLGTYHRQLTDNDAANTYHPQDVFGQGQNNYLALKADTALGQVAFYVNAETHKTAGLASGGSVLTAPNFYLGNAFDGSATRMFEGEIHTVRVYSRALSEDELDTNRSVDLMRHGDESACRVSSLFRQSRTVGLTVVSSVSGAGELAPDRGSYPDVVALLPLTCTAPEYTTNGATLYRCTGSVLTDGAGVAVTNAGHSTVFNPEGSGVWTLSWQWEAVAHTVTVTAKDGVGRAPISVTEPDIFGFYTIGSTVTATASSTDPTVFDHWEGDVPAGQERSPTITLVVDGNKGVQAVFRSVCWLYDGGDAINNGYTILKVSADGPKMTVCGYRYSGVGGDKLDLTLPVRAANGDAYALTAIGAKSFYKYAGITGIRLPETIETIGDYAFYECRGLRYVTPFLPKRIQYVGTQAFLAAPVTNALELGFGKTVVLNPEGSQFSECSGIPSMRLGRGVRELPQYFAYHTVKMVRFESFALQKLNRWSLGQWEDLKDVYFGRYHVMDPEAFLPSDDDRPPSPDYGLRLYVPRYSAEWDAYVADDTKVTPWAKVGEVIRAEYFKRFGADAKPPVGLTCATDRLPANQWVMRWNAGSGLMLLLK